MSKSRYDINMARERIDLAFARVAIVLILASLILFILAIIFDNGKLGQVGVVSIGFGFISAFVYMLRIA